MAISAAIVWEVRSTGSNTNGGGFKTGATGTDWTQQDSAQYSVTDGVTAGTTTITSATANFGTDVVGNIIYVQGGTGSITAGWYEITARTDSSTITVDRSTGLTTGTGVTLKIGGGLATLQQAITNHIGSNTIYIKSGSTYTFTATITPTSGTSDAPTQLIGYTTTRTDGGQATLQNSSGSYNLVTNSGNYIWYKNLILDGNNLSGYCVSHGSGNDVLYENITARGFGSFGFVIATGRVLQSRCACTANKAGATTGFYAADGGTTYVDCIAYNLTCVGYYCTNAFAVQFIRCIAANCTGSTSDGFFLNSLGLKLFTNCIAYKCGRDGIRLATAGVSNVFHMKNCILVSNGNSGGTNAASAYGINNQTGTTSLSSNIPADYNFFYNNKTGARSNFPTGAHDVTLTGDPFTDGSNNDFSLNSTAGAGAACRGAGFPGVVGSSTGYIDGGAFQHQDSGGGGIKINPGLNGNING